MNNFEELNSNSSDEILLSLATNFGGMANVILPKLNCDNFSDEDEQLINSCYKRMARMQERIIKHLNNKGAI